MAALACETNAYCKLSGLLTEAGDNWTPSDIGPYVAHLMDHFGWQRLIWGSDWPVLTIAADYGTWADIAKSLIPGEQQNEAIFGANAVDAYSLSSR